MLALPNREEMVNSFDLHLAGNISAATSDKRLLISFPFLILAIWDRWQFLSCLEFEHNIVLLFVHHVVGRKNSKGDDKKKTRQHKVIAVGEKPASHLLLCVPGIKELRKNRSQYFTVRAKQMKTNLPLGSAGPPPPARPSNRPKSAAVSEDD